MLQEPYELIYALKTERYYRCLVLIAVSCCEDFIGQLQLTSRDMNCFISHAK